MKFELRHPHFGPVTISWNPEIDVRASSLEMLAQLRTLKSLIDEEFDSDDDFSEVSWVNERIVGLEQCEGINPQSEQAQRLAEEIYRISAIQEELDNLSDPESTPIVRHLAWLAGRCLRRET